MMSGARARIAWSVVATVTGFLVVALGLQAIPAVAATLTNPITYVYDDIGRIEAAIDTTQTNGLAKYIYDANGNLTQITRTAITTTPQIVDFHPHKVATGSPITIYGTGFSSTPSQNVVTFIGGATATATAATQTTATVTVPANAQAGAIKIKNTATNKTSALSSQTWSTPSAAPTITLMTTPLGGTPPKANYGDTVTLTGTGFSTNTADDFVRVNAAAVKVTSATATQLTFQVPSFDRDILGYWWIGSGSVTLRTPNGTATAPQDLILPAGSLFLPYDKVVRVQPVANQQVTLTSGQLNLIVLVHAARSQTVSVTATSGNSESLTNTLYDPFGQGWGGLPGNSAQISPNEGDWTIYVQRPNGATGSNTITIDAQVASAKLAGNIPTDGVAHSISCSYRGQQVQGTFQGTAGRNYNFQATGQYFSQGFVHVFAPSQPTGDAMPDGAGPGLYKPLLNGSGSFLAPETGTYSFLIKPAYLVPCPQTVTISDLGLAPIRIANPSRHSLSKPAPSVPTMDPGAVGRVVSSFSPTDGPSWAPSADPREWITRRGASPLETVAPLQAPTGTTALAGRVLALNGAPLQGIRVTAGRATATTDEAGRFLLSGLAAGHVIFTVDARRVSTSATAYGVFQIGADVVAGVTTALDYTVWEPALDLATKVHIDSYPLANDLVITSPKMPGFEVHIPAGSTIVDASGNQVHDVTLTPVPLDRPPFPGPQMDQFTMHFTLQPGDATVEPNGFRVIYANNRNLPPGFVGRLWNYEPDHGWETYGFARVTPDGTQVIPQAGLHIGGFQGASMSPYLLALHDSLCDLPLLGRICSADPVGYGNGLFDYKMTDLVEPGTPSISLTRFYKQNDELTYGTGLSMATTYDMLLTSDDTTNHAYLGIPGQERVTFKPVNGPGTGLPMVAVSGPPEWLGAELNGVYDIRRRDGMRFHFGDHGVGTTWVTDISDASGNETIIERAYTGEILWILGEPSGRWISFTRAGNGTVTSATDSAGRTVSYTYSTSTPYRMLTVTDPSQQGLPTPAKTTYDWNPDTTLCLAYDAQHRQIPCDPSPGTEIFDVHDRRGNHQIHLDYDSQARVSQQTFANGATQTFDYASSDPSCTGFTRAVDPNGNVTCARFTGGQLSSVTTAQGTPLERTLTYAFDPNNSNVSSVTDDFKVSGVSHTRQTTYTYDGRGNVSQVSYLANTAPKTWLFNYDLGYSSISKVTDPLGHERRLTHSYPDGCLTRVEDQLSHGVTLTCAPTGAVATVTSDLPGATASVFTYTNGDLTKVADPLGDTTTRYVGSDGNLRAVTGPLGYQTTLGYDVLGDPTKISPVSGSSTSFTYDLEQDLTKATTDSNGAHTDYVYNELNLRSSRTDQLSRQETFSYDLAGNLKKWVDRRGKVTKYCYDAQNDLSFIGYGYTGGGEPACNSTFTSSTSYTYDGAGRLGQVDDSRSGQITRAYDDLDRLTNETTPQGSIAYSYDDANRRSTMTVTGQPQVAYTYFTDDLLQTITRGTNIVNLAYDVANRPATTTLPDGIVEKWTYDQASRMTQIDYDKTPTHYGTIDYGYDAAGRRTTVWDPSTSFARVTLPAATTSNATYDLANELNTWNGTALSYDADGNIATNGSQTYTFDERNQLTATSGGTTTYKYDGLARRYEKTISGTTTRFLYDGPNAAQELNGSNAVIANSITGFAPDQILWRSAGGVTRNFLTDALGSTVATYDSAATPVLQTAFTYEPYGKPDQTGLPMFTGATYESGTGLQYNRARYYAPKFGRFVSEDPIGLAGGSANGYKYAADAPTMLADPYGLNPGQHECGSFSLSCISSSEWLVLGLDAIAILLGVAAFGAAIGFFPPLLGFLGVEATALGEAAAWLQLSTGVTVISTVVSEIQQPNYLNGGVAIATTSGGYVPKSIMIAEGLPARYVTGPIGDVAQLLWDLYRAGSSR